jgi:hypothetical protein
MTDLVRHIGHIVAELVPEHTVAKLQIHQHELTLLEFERILEYSYLFMYLIIMIIIFSNNII